MSENKYLSKPVMLDETGVRIAEALENRNAKNRVVPLSGSKIETDNVITCIGVPEYVSDVSKYADYGITETGWYEFARIYSKDAGRFVSVTGADGYIGDVGTGYVDVAVRFEVAATSKIVEVEWNIYTERFVFVANDLGFRNLDYRVTFYVYDADEFATWHYRLATGSFAAGTNYYVKKDGVYTPAEVTAGEAIQNYYVHSDVVIDGLVRNVTYRLNEIVDCPMVFILPEVEDETHGCWFEIRCRHSGAYSMELVPPTPDVKIATEHTQKETAGINMINLHYTNVDGVKIWRFMNTHSNIPA